MTNNCKPASVHLAAVTIGGLGGKQTAKKHGVKQFRKMARKAHKTKVKRYGGNNFYKLIAHGYSPSKMTHTECEDALNKIEAEKKAGTQ